MFQFIRTALEPTKLLWVVAELPLQRHTFQLQVLRDDNARLSHSLQQARLLTSYAVRQ